MHWFALLLTLLLGFDEEPAVADVAGGAATYQEKRAATNIQSVPWQMYCNFIVRTIESPGDKVIVVAKRDCN